MIQIQMIWIVKHKNKNLHISEMAQPIFMIFCMVARETFGDVQQKQQKENYNIHFGKGNVFKKFVGVFWLPLEN